MKKILSLLALLVFFGFTIMSCTEDTAMEPDPDPGPDNEAPEITLTGDASVSLLVGEAFVDPGATANDAEDGDISADITIATNPALDINTAGTYTLTYTVLDSDGAAATPVDRDVIYTNAGGAGSVAPEAATISVSSNADVDGAGGEVVVDISSAVNDGYVVVTLSDSNDSIISTMTNTDESVDVEFTGVAAGDYTVDAQAYTDADASEGAAVNDEAITVRPATKVLKYSYTVAAGNPWDVQLKFDPENIIDDMAIDNLSWRWKLEGADTLDYQAQLVFQTNGVKSYDSYTSGAYTLTNYWTNQNYNWFWHGFGGDIRTASNSGSPVIPVGSTMTSLIFKINDQNLIGQDLAFYIDDINYWDGSVNQAGARGAIDGTVGDASLPTGFEGSYGGSPEIVLEYTD